MTAKDIWTHANGSALEVYRSTERRGNRYSMNGVATSYKIRGAHIGVNGWATRADAHAFLAGRGWVRTLDKPSL